MTEREKELNVAVKNLDKIKQERNNLSKTLKNNQQELKDAEQKQRDSEAKLNDLKEIDKRLGESIKVYEKSLRQLKQQQQTNQSGQKAQRDRNQAMQNEHKQMDVEKNRLNGAVQEAIRKCAALEETIKSGQERLAYLSMSISELNAKKRECDTEKRNVDRQIVYSKEEISNKKREITEKKADLRRNEQLVKEKIRALDDQRRTLANATSKKTSFEWDVHNKVIIFLKIIFR